MKAMELKFHYTQISQLENHMDINSLVMAESEI